MDYLGKTQEERNHIRSLLLKKYGRLDVAAEKIKLSKYTLSRVLNGVRRCELETLVKILKGTGHLKEKQYRYPKEDFETFCFVNGLMNFSLK